MSKNLELSPETESADRINAFAWRMDFKPTGFAVAFGEESRPFFETHASDREEGLRIRHIAMFVSHLETLDSVALKADFRLTTTDVSIMTGHLAKLGLLAIEQDVTPDDIAVETQITELQDLGQVA